MRLLFTAILWLVILGGTWLYLRLDSGLKREATHVEFAQADGITQIQIERTFDCFGDSEFHEPAIKVTFGGQDVILNESDSIPADRKVEFELPNVEAQKNTLTVFANAQTRHHDESQVAPLRAMVVRVRYNDQTIKEKVFHSSKADPWLGGEVTFEIVAGQTTDD